MDVKFQILDLTKSEDYNKVGWFFSNERKGSIDYPCYFDEEHWGQCTEAIVAKKNSKIVGIVTLEPKGLSNAKKPTLNLVYVQKDHRNRGLGYTLLVKGIERLTKSAGEKKIFCQVNKKAQRLVDRLPSELRQLLEVKFMEALNWC